MSGDVLHLNVDDLVRYSGLAVESHPSLLAEILSIFLETTPKTMARLHEAMAKGDLNAVSRTMHSLKGTVGTFGAAKLAALCKHLNEELRQGHVPENLPARVDEIKEEYDAVCCDMQRLLEVWQTE